MTNAAEQQQPPPEELHPGDPQEAPGLIVQILGMDLIHRINTDAEFCQAIMTAVVTACVAHGVPVGVIHKQTSAVYAMLEKERRVRALRESMT